MYCIHQQGFHSIITVMPECHLRAAQLLCGLDDRCLFKFGTKTAFDVALLIRIPLQNLIYLGIELVKGDTMVLAESNNLAEIHIRKTELDVNTDHLKISVCEF